MHLLRSLAVVALITWLGCAVAGAECVSAPELAPAVIAPAPAPGPAPAGAPPADPSAVGPTRADLHGRVIAPVMVNGQGPFRFVVDTGANRSVLSQRLADSLGLTPIGTNEVNTIDSVQLAPMVRVDSISYGSVEVNDQSVPILDGPMLGGEQGLLGVDGMGGKRLRLDFDQRCIEIIPAHTAPVLRGWVRLRGKLRFGHLVVVPGHVGDTRVNVLIDTGSDVSLANTAFRTVMQRVWFDRETQNLIVAYTTGRPIQLNNAVILPELGLGDVAITNMTLFTGDFHVFHVWGMTDEPTILVGMDVLSRTHAISIDYERAMVFLRLPHTF